MKKSVFLHAKDCDKEKMPPKKDCEIRNLCAIRFTTESYLPGSTLLAVHIGSLKNFLPASQREVDRLQLHVLWSCGGGWLAVYLSVSRRVWT